MHTKLEQLYSAIDGRDPNEVKSILTTLNESESQEVRQNYRSFSLAIKLDQLEIVEALIEHGQNLALLDEQHKHNALHVAAGADPSKRIISLLIKKGVDINCRDEKNHSPLYWLAMKGTLHLKLAHPDPEGKQDMRPAILEMLAAGAEIYDITYDNKYYDFYPLIQGPVDLKTAIEKIFGDKMPPLVEVRKDENGKAIYRQADKNGEPVKTFSELSTKEFKKSANYFVASSIFFNNPVAQPLCENGLGEYLSKREIANVFESSALKDTAGNIERDKKNNVTNSTTLKKLDDEAKLKASTQIVKKF